MIPQVCLSISSHHPEHWQPSWSVRTALTALIAFMPTPGNGAIGSLVRPAMQTLALTLSMTLAVAVTLHQVPASDHDCVHRLHADARQRRHQLTGAAALSWVVGLGYQSRPEIIAFCLIASKHLIVSSPGGETMDGSQQIRRRQMAGCRGMVPGLRQAR